MCIFSILILLMTNFSHAFPCNDSMSEEECNEVECALYVGQEFR